MSDVRDGPWRRRNCHTGQIFSVCPKCPLQVGLDFHMIRSQFMFMFKFMLDLIFICIIPFRLPPLEGTGVSGHPTSGN